MNPTVRRAATILAAAALGALAFASPAAAHVTLDPVTAEAEGYARLDLRVPNESDDAATVKIEVNLPEDAPLASVRTKKVEGWSVKTKERKLDEPIDMHGREVDKVVGSITWTADSKKTGIQPGEFGEFAISVGPLPKKTGILVFKTIQTYSDKSESAWIDEPNEDGSEPAEPAPTLEVVPATSGGEHGAMTGDDDDDAEDHADEDDEGAGSGTTILAAIGVGLATVALVVAVLAFLARQRDAKAGSKSD